MNEKTYPVMLTEEQIQQLEIFCELAVKSPVSKGLETAALALPILQACKAALEGKEQ